MFLCAGCPWEPGNEGLSNGDSYFILSIIYGETRFRKGHCANMGDACHKHPP